MNTSMQSTTISADNETSIKQPRIPNFLSKPITMIPERVHSNMIVKSLNLFLAEALKEGELDFLQGLSVSVEIRDLKLKFALSLNHEKLRARTWQAKDDLNLSGNLYDFMQLASRQEDSDTLFFHRRLKMEGNTELGLEVKNLLDGMDVETVRFHKQMDYVLYHGIKIFERLF